MALIDLATRDTAAPRARLLSNGSYGVLLSGAGGGYSQWHDTLLTAWEGDRVEDGDGLFVYLRDCDDGATWSLGAQPCGLGGAERYAAVASPGGVRLGRRERELDASLAVCVFPDLDAELRRLTIRNASGRTRRLEVTWYAPLVLNALPAHAAHPAFSKLFVETELITAAALSPSDATPPFEDATPPFEKGGKGGISEPSDKSPLAPLFQRGVLARRRPRSAGEHPPLMGLAIFGGESPSFDTDRARLLGRNRRAATLAALEAGGPLAGGVGSVLDPAFAARVEVVIPAGATATVDVVLAAAADRAALLALWARSGDAGLRDGAWDAAAAAERARRAALGLDDAEAERLQDLAVALLYQDPAVGAGLAERKRPRGAVSQLWGHAMGGRPLIVARDAGLLPRLLTAHAYWTRLGLGIDMLVLAADAAAVEAGQALIKERGGAPGVQVQARDAFPAADLAVALAWASLVVGEDLPAPGRMPIVPIAAAAPAPPPSPAPAPASELEFDNGAGAFTAGGREYRIVVGPDAAARPPLAWINVIGHDSFGALVSESGAGYTWSRNSREHRLTPWRNDPVGDPHDEALYVRDEASGAFWSPQPGPCPSGTYEVRHGFGWTRWRGTVGELEQEVTCFVPLQQPVKLTRLRITNRGSAPRRLALYSYARLVLGVTPRETARLVCCARDKKSGAWLAANRLADEFGDGDAFAAVAAPDGAALSGTCDRAAFLGQDGSSAAPAALRAGGELDGRAAAGLDPCFAQRVAVEVAAGASVECTFLLGEAVKRKTLAELVQRYATPAAVEAALAAVRGFWDETLGAVQVRTPSRAIDLMLNGWLLYQVLSCRLWGRSALYQSGGAYGFRDQLQDSAALVYTRPDLMRAQLLLHAAHQFVEGDVLHWWHPPLARGIRTRFSDDLLWLPYLTAYYIGVTGDRAILKQRVGFLQARPLAPGEDEAYLLPGHATERTDLYDHCCRAIDRSLAVGAHGLPLMGTGDWNDGMNRVGREGKGESVWVGFFLYDLLGAFIPFCVSRGDSARAERYGQHREALRAALNDGGWDGAWYRRAYYDDGTPLGSAQSDECKIDVLAQSWAVISGAAPAERAAQAMQAVDERLVMRDAGLIRLLAPPFDTSAHDPGYIKGYVPGIRENGGQYTHGATWVVMALAMMGRRADAAPYYEMLTPVQHGGSADAIATFQVEPYVICADVYGVAPHVGRGGWTWYTGSAAWMYRIGLERVLGIRVAGGDTLIIDPRIPDAWPGFDVTLRLNDGASRYTVTVENPSGSAARVVHVELDGAPSVLADGVAHVPLLRDNAPHAVRVVLG
ncbi:MAG: glycosyl transferase [Deltaproteobacteria bacterium]|nr:glycosyl transferase [Deltaproteobacteria bacterium]